MERRRQLYEDALREVRKDEGTPYPCRQSDLDDYRPSSHVFRPYAPYVSPDQACTDAVHQNTRKRKRSPKEQDAIDRLFGAVIEAEKDWTPDLIIKMFADLDIVFFGGHLRGNVFVKWYKPKSYAKRAMDPQPHSWGCTLFPTPGMAHICLNAKQILVDSIIKSPFRQMWSTMLHEMCVSFSKKFELLSLSFELAIKMSSMHTILFGSICSIKITKIIMISTFVPSYMVSIGFLDTYSIWMLSTK